MQLTKFCAFDACEISFDYRAYVALDLRIFLNSLNKLDRFQSMFVYDIMPDVAQNGHATNFRSLLTFHCHWPASDFHIILLNAVSGVYKVLLPIILAKRGSGSM